MFNTQANRPKLTAAEAEIWQALVWERSGLHFSRSRLYFLEMRLWERTKQCGLKSYTDYYHYVLYNENGRSEWTALLDNLLNNETSFFRHQPSYTALREQALPTLLREKRRQGHMQLSFWSAGCSGGQEAYSLAMLLLETVDSHLWQLRVLGSDISQNKLTQARQGRYKQHEVRYMPDLYRNKYMRWSQTGVGTFYEVVQRVQNVVQFGYMNFKEPSSYWVTGQDVIFCQNVLIYFKPDHRIEIVKELLRRLNPGGYLFLAPAEMVGLRLPGIELMKFADSLVYKRMR
ncbi:MAG: protein-glutamate O-methyltransferase CheR [Chloroflexota bacterium]